MQTNIYLDQLPAESGRSQHKGPSPMRIVRVGASLNTHACHHHLSTIDQISPTAYVGSYLCFKTPANVDKLATFNHIALGLQHALAEFPHMAGKIVSVNRPAQGRAIETDGYGVLVSLLDWTTPEQKAKWAFSTFEEIAEARFPMAHMPSYLLMPQSGLANLGKISPDRCQYVQVNFIEGGVILGSQYNHACSDGPGFSVFVESWARYTREIASGVSPTQTYPASFDGARTVMSTGLDGSQLKDFPFWKPVAADAATNEPSVPLAGELPQHSIWSISAAKLAELQATVMKASNAPVSKNDALCALLWRHCTRARGLHDDPQSAPYTHSTLSCTVNTRSSMGLPKNYIGNACEPNANTKLPIAELCAPSDASLAKTALALRATIKSVDSTAVRRLIGMLQTLPSPKSVTWNVDRWPGPDMLITNMFHAGRCAHSWGPVLGQPQVHRTVINADDPVDGRCYIFSAASSTDAAEFLLSYPSRVVERLRRDQEFAHYVEYLG